MTSKKRLSALAALLVAASALATQRAPVAITEPAPFLRLDSTPEAWRASQGTRASDWRLIDANGLRVPFAAVPEESTAARPSTWRNVPLYSLPPEAQRHPKLPKPKTPAGTVLDLGEPQQRSGQARQLRLQWPEGTPPFEAGYRLQTSANLQDWRDIGSGQLLNLLGADGTTLQQPTVALTSQPGRYLRLQWDDPERAVVPSSAQVLEVAGEPAFEPHIATLSAPLPAPDADGAMHLQLGGPQLLRSLQLKPTQGTWVLPMLVQVRDGASRPWTTLSNAVFFRIDRNGRADLAPPIDLDTSATELRLLSPKGTALPPAGQLVAQLTVVLPSFVWVAQGQAPYQLEVDSKAPDSGPAPLSQVVPNWHIERNRLGQSELGAFVALPPAPPPAQTGMSAQQRQWLLWSVLGLGVLGLGLAVLRLARQGHTDHANQESSAN